MALAIREQKVKVKHKSRKGFILVYSFIAMFVCMVLIALLVQASYRYRLTTENRVGTTGAVLTVQSGVDLMESVLDTWWQNSLAESDSFITESLETAAVRVYMLLDSSITEGSMEQEQSTQRMYTVCKQTVNGTMSNGVWQSDSTGTEVEVLVTAADLRELYSSTGLLNFYVRGSSRVNGKVVYKWAKVSARIAARRTGTIGDIQAIGLDVIEYSEEYPTEF